MNKFTYAIIIKVVFLFCSFLPSLFFTAFYPEHAKYIKSEFATVSQMFNT